MYYSIQVHRRNMRLEYLIINLRKECPRESSNVKIMRDRLSREHLLYFCVLEDCKNTSYFKLNHLSMDIKTRIVVLINLQLYKSRGRCNKFHSPPC